MMIAEMFMLNHPKLYVKKAVQRGIFSETWNHGKMIMYRAVSFNVGMACKDEKV